MTSAAELPDDYPSRNLGGPMNRRTDDQIAALYRLMRRGEGYLAPLVCVDLLEELLLLRGREDLLQPRGGEAIDGGVPRVDHVGSDVHADHH